MPIRHPEEQRYSVITRLWKLDMDAEGNPCYYVVDADAIVSTCFVVPDLGSNYVFDVDFPSTWGNNFSNATD